MSLGAFLVAQLAKNLPAMWETLVRSPLLGKSPGEGNGNPLQYSCLENPMDRAAPQARVHGVEKSWTRLSMYAHMLTMRENLHMQGQGDMWENVCALLSILL